MLPPQRRPLEGQGKRKENGGVVESSSDAAEISPGPPPAERKSRDALNGLLCILRRRRRRRLSDILNVMSTERGGRRRFNTSALVDDVGESGVTVPLENRNASLRRHHHLHHHHHHHHRFLFFPLAFVGFFSTEAVERRFTTPGFRCEIRSRNRRRLCFVVHLATGALFFSTSKYGYRATASSRLLNDAYVDAAA